MATFLIDQGGWIETRFGSVDGKYANFTTTNANASSLFATSILGPGNKTDITLLYENLNGDMIMIRGTSSLYSDLIWRDISPELRSAAPDAILRSSFSSGSVMAGRSEIIVTEARSLTSRSMHEGSIITYQNGKFTSREEVLLPPGGADTFLPNANDGGAILFSINQPRGQIYFSSFNTSLTPNYRGLSGQFPFSKAAALFSGQSGPFIVYHQTNNLSIAEKIWDVNIGGWINGTWIDYDN